MSLSRRGVGDRTFTGSADLCDDRDSVDAEPYGGQECSDERGCLQHCDHCLRSSRPERIEKFTGEKLGVIPIRVNRTPLSDERSIPCEIPDPNNAAAAPQTTGIDRRPLFQTCMSDILLGEPCIRRSSPPLLRAKHANKSRNGGGSRVPKCATGRAGDLRNRQHRHAAYLQRISEYGKCDRFSATFARCAPGEQDCRRLFRSPG